MRNSMGGPA